MTKNRKNPLRHTGKIIPVRTKADVLNNIQKEVARLENGNPPIPSLDYYREEIAMLLARELALVKSEDDRQAYNDERTTILSEASTWLWQIEKYIHDSDGNPIDISSIDATRIALIGVHVGQLIAVARMRFMEPWVYDAWQQSQRGHDLSKNSAERAYKTDRESLLAKCRSYYRRYKCNQKELVEYIAKGLPIGPERVRQLLKEMEIRKADYEK